MSCAPGETREYFCYDCLVEPDPEKESVESFAGREFFDFDALPDMESDVEPEDKDDSEESEEEKAKKQMKFAEKQAKRAKGEVEL